MSRQIGATAAAKYDWTNKTYGENAYKKFQDIDSPYKTFHWRNKNVMVAQVWAFTDYKQENGDSVNSLIRDIRTYCEELVHRCSVDYFMSYHDPGKDKSECNSKHPV